LHGERAARLNSGQSIFEPKGPTWFIRILSPVFLFAPQGYLKKLDKASVDSVANQRTWKEMVLQLSDEWKDFTLLVSTHSVVASFDRYSSVSKATVLLTTNVGFLAIQSVDTSHTTIVHQASYVSILSSMGSIILGLLLARQHRTTLDVRPSSCIFLDLASTTFSKTDFVARRGVSRLGFETLALMYSLPYALLVWG
jgi:hypothetical protein